MWNKKEARNIASLYGFMINGCALPLFYHSCSFRCEMHDSTSRKCDCRWGGGCCGAQVSFHDGRHRIAQSLVSDEESLGGTELQEHVEAHGYVVGVVADVEAHNLLVLAFLKLHV